ncbi:MAG: RluA family pseudouridine synthase, partial [Pseudomonadota bacterium]
MAEEQFSEDNTVVTVQAEDLEKYSRLDHFLTDRLAPLGRSFIKKIFEKDLIYAEDSTITLKLKKMPAVGTVIIVQIPSAGPCSLVPENIPLDILFEDEHLLFVNKPAGMVTHPAVGNLTGTLANAVLYHCPDLSGIGGEKRPGIVHRLDKGTSGIMVVAKTQLCHEGLSLLFSTHNIERTYQALTIGHIRLSQGKLQSTLGRHPVHRQKMAANVAHGRNAITHYRVLEKWGDLNHLQLT